MARIDLLPALVLCLTIAGCGGGNKPPDSDNDTVADASDCAPQDPQAWQTRDFSSRDDDADGFRVNSAGQVCAGSALPPKLFAAAVSGVDADCNDGNATIWATLQYAAVDSDRDGFGVASSGSICGGAALPPGMLATVPATQDLDCDDADPVRWRWMGVYHDADGDGIGSGAATRACIGSAPAQGYALTGYDPLDDPNNPWAATVSTVSLDSALLSPSEEGDDDDSHP